MADSIRLPTTWRILYKEPYAPDTVMIQSLGTGSATLQTMSFSYPVFLEFADQIAEVASILRRQAAP